MTRVFVSSTSKDLGEFRAVLRDALAEAGYEIADMAHFGAQDGDAVQVSEDELKRSDVVVGIYALRYGYIPEGSTKSITEMEYDWAFQYKKPLLAFVLDEAFRNVRSAIWKEQDSANAEHLEDFKDRIKKERVVATFNDAKGLAASVIASLRKWESRANKNSESDDPPEAVTITINADHNSGVIVGKIGNISGGNNNFGSNNTTNSNT